MTRTALVRGLLGVALLLGGIVDIFVLAERLYRIAGIMLIMLGCFYVHTATESFWKSKGTKAISVRERCCLGFLGVSMLLSGIMDILMILPSEKPQHWSHLVAVIPMVMVGTIWIIEAATKSVGVPNESDLESKDKAN